MERKGSVFLCLTLCSLMILFMVSDLTWAQCVPTGNAVNGSLGTGDPEFGTRVIRTHIASECDPQKTYPGETAPGGYYDLYEYPNGCWQDTCVTVTYNSGTCGTDEAFISAWLYGFDPTDTTTWDYSYLGDIGWGPDTTGSFSFSVPSHAPFYLLVQNTDGSFSCDYSFTISATPCNPTSICQDSCVGDICYYNCLSGACPSSHCDVYIPGSFASPTSVGQMTYHFGMFACLGPCPPTCEVYIPITP